MITTLEEIATHDNGVYRLEFGRIRLGDIDRYYLKVNGETITLKEESLTAFLGKIKAYGTANNTLFGDNLKSGISTGITDTSQIVEKQPPAHTPVKACGLYQGA